MPTSNKAFKSSLHSMENVCWLLSFVARRFAARLSTISLYVEASHSAFRANEKNQSYTLAIPNHSLQMPDPGSFAAK